MTLYNKEAEALNEFEQLQNKLQFYLNIIFRDKGSEDMGMIATYCKSNIQLTVFKGSTGYKDSTITRYYSL